MRLALLGGLTTLLVALVVFGGVLVAHGHLAPGATGDDEPDHPQPPSPRSRGNSVERRLPSLAAMVCLPKPGQACWRGRLRLSDVVRKAWRKARADRAERVVREAALARGAGAEGTDSLQSGDGTEAAVVSEDSDVSDSSTSDDQSGPGDDQPRALPPEASYGMFFKVRAVPRDDQPGLPVDQPGHAFIDRATSARPTIDEAIARVAADGTFDLDVTPGRYDLEVTSQDDLLVGGIDGINARAGDARDGLDLVIGIPVAIGVRVVDDDGVGVIASLEVRRLHHDGDVILNNNDTGRFLVGGLRPGPYILFATTEGGASPPVEVGAPLDEVELRVARLPSAMVLVGPDSDGRCPHGKIVLTSQDAKHERRGSWLENCQAIVRSVRPGSTWRVVGRMVSNGPGKDNGNRLTPANVRSFDRVISFGFGKPLAPVCLDSVCQSDVAAVDARVVDTAGDLVDSAEIEILAGLDTGPPAGLMLSPITLGLRAGTTLTLRATAGSLEATTSIWLAVGVNETVIHIPGRVTRPD